MTQVFTDNYLKICMKSWLLCEAFVHTEISRQNPREGLLDPFKECAQSCFSMVGYLVGDDPNLDDLSLRCMIHCQEVRKLCLAYPNDKELQACKRACTSCIEMIGKEYFLQGLN